MRFYKRSLVVNINPQRSQVRLYIVHEHYSFPPSSFLSSNLQNPRFLTLGNGLLASITSLCAIITCNSNITENHLLCWEIQIFLISQLSHQQYFPQTNIDLLFQILIPMTTFTFTHLNLYPREELKKNKLFWITPSNKNNLVF